MAYKSLLNEIGAGFQKVIDQNYANMDHQRNTKEFIEYGYDPMTAKFLARTKEQSPQDFYKVLETLGKGRGHANMQGNQNPTIAESFGRPAAALNKNPSSPSNRSVKDQSELVATIDHIRKIKRLSKAALDELKTGKVKTGLTSKYLKNTLGVNWLNENTENFDKYTDEILTEESDTAKGIQSVFKVKLRQNGKPGLNHSNNVNERILKDIYKKSSNDESRFFKMYEDLKPLYDEENNQAQSQSQSASPKIQVNQKTGEVRINGKVITAQEYRQLRESGAL